MGYKRYTMHFNFTKKILDTNILYDCFIENYKLLIDRLKCKLGERSLSKNLFAFYQKRFGSQCFSFVFRMCCRIYFSVKVFQTLQVILSNVIDRLMFLMIAILFAM